MATVPEDDEDGHGTLESRSDRDLADFEELSDYGGQSGGTPDLGGTWWVAGCWAVGVVVGGGGWSGVVWGGQGGGV
jgi:hypothetical protein